MSSSAALDGLLCFARVVEAGSFAAAARRMGLTTSGVSKIIARFEASYGVRLLHRSTHSLSPTLEGKRLLTEAREALRAVERLQTALAKATDGGQTGSVRISAPTAFVRTCLVPVLPRFLERHPDVRLDIRANDNMADLAEEGVDLALRSGRITGVPGHLVQTLFAFPWVACATSGYLAQRGVPQSPAALVEHELIGFRNGGTGTVQAWRFRSGDVAGNVVRHLPDARLVLDDAQSAWALAVAGHGIAWAPEWLALDDLRTGHVAEVLRDWRCEEMQMSVLRRERRPGQARTEAVIAFLREAAADAWRDAVR